MSRPHRIVFVGSCGHVGHLIAPLLPEPPEFRCAGLDVRGEHDCPWGERARGDVLNCGDLLRALRGADTVVYLAMGSYHDSRALFEGGVYGFYNVLQVAEVSGVRTVMLASTLSVFGDGEFLNECGRLTDDEEARGHDPYAMSKVAAEGVGRAFHETSGLSVVALRLGAPCPDDDPRLGERRSPCFKLAATDLVRAILAVAAMPRSERFEAFALVGKVSSEMVDVSRAETLTGWRPTW